LDPGLSTAHGICAAEGGLICSFDDNGSQHLGMDGADEFVSARLVELERETVILIQPARAE
jgi:hypothetical protein